MTRYNCLGWLGPTKFLTSFFLVIRKYKRKYNCTPKLLRPMTFLLIPSKFLDFHPFTPVFDPLTLTKLQLQLPAQFILELQNL